MSDITYPTTVPVDATRGDEILRALDADPADHYAAAWSFLTKGELRGLLAANRRARELETLLRRAVPLIWEHSQPPEGYAQIGPSFFDEVAAALAGRETP